MATATAPSAASASSADVSLSLEFSGSETQSFTGYIACDALILALCTLLLFLQLGLHLFKSRAAPLPHHYLTILAYICILTGLSGDLHRLSLSKSVQSTLVDLISHPARAVQDLDNVVTWSVTIARWVFAAPFLYYSALWALKAALVAAAVQKRAYLPGAATWAVYAVGAYVGLTYVIIMFAHAFWCKPASNWDVEGASELCTPYMSIGYSALAFVFSATTDLLVLATSVFLVLRLHPTSRERMAVAALVLVGLVSVASTAVRFALEVALRNELAGASRARSGNALGAWAAVESLTAFACITLPGLRAAWSGQRAPRGDVNARRFHGSFRDGSEAVSSADFEGKNEMIVREVGRGDGLASSDGSYAVSLSDGSRPQTGDCLVANRV